MDKVIEQIAIKHLREAYPLVSEEKFIELYAENNPVHKAYLNAMLEVSQLSPTIPATSWEEVLENAKEFARTRVREKYNWDQRHVTLINECVAYEYEQMLDYLSQHWPSSQPVSPTPMSETWEELKMKAYEHACTVYGNPDDADGFHFWLQHYNNYLAPSLHQVDRWVRVEDLNIDELPKHPTKTWRSELVLITDGNRWGEGYYNYLNSEWEHGHSSYNAKPTHYKIISLPAAPETDKK